MNPYLRLCSVLLFALASHCSADGGGRYTDFWQGNYVSGSNRISLPFLYHRYKPDSLRIVNLMQGDSTSIGFAMLGSKAVRMGGDTLAVFSKNDSEFNYGTVRGSDDFFLSTVRKSRISMELPALREHLEAGEWYREIPRTHDAVRALEYYSFSGDSVDLRREFRLGDSLVDAYQLRLGFRLTHYGGQHFLSMHGSPRHDGLYAIAGQVIQAEKDRIRLFVGKNASQDFLDLQPSGNQAGTATEIPLRQECSPDYRREYYYDMNSCYLEGGRLHKVRKSLATLSSPPQAGLDGWIRIRFVLNCTGTPSDWSVLEMDGQYHYTKFPETMTLEVMRLLKGLGPWRGALDGEVPVDCNKHITFKIKDGQIVDVLP